MRARYAKIRGQKKEEPVKEEPVEETSVPQPQKAVKETNPYVRLMQEDIENLMKNCGDWITLGSPFQLSEILSPRKPYKGDFCSPKCVIEYLNVRQKSILR